MYGFNNRMKENKTKLLIKTRGWAKPFGVLNAMEPPEIYSGEYVRYGGSQ